MGLIFGELPHAAAGIDRRVEGEKEGDFRRAIDEKLHHSQCA